MLAIVLVAVIVGLPSLGNGLTADDHWHKITLTRDATWSPVAKPWYELFTFYDGDPARTHFIVDSGLSPWWTDPHVTLSFFRPVSSATHALDYALWPSSPWLMHLHSIAWYALLALASTWMYRRLVPGWAAALAALLYAVDHSHAIPLAWLANRNALVAAFFALAALATHDVAARGRGGEPPLDHAREPTPGGMGWSIGSALLFGLGLGSGEGALAVVGYFAAHAVFLDARSWRAKLGSLAPHAVVACAWLAAYRLGGFGVRGSGVYIEPLREPVQFVVALAKHLPLLVAAELGAPPPDLYTFLPAAVKVGFLVVALLFLAWASVAVVRVCRVDPRARFFAAGAVLATVPACTTFPSGRLLVLPGFGLIGLVALMGAGVLDGASWVPAAGASRRLVRSFAFWACGGHLLLSPLALEMGMQQLPVLDGLIARLGAELPTSPRPGLKRVVFMNVPDAVFAPYLFLGHAPRGQEGGPVRLPARLLTMAAGARAVDLRRTDEHTVVVSVEGGFYRMGTELITRNEATPLPAGTKLAFTDYTVEVLETAPDGVPTVAAFRFDEPADSAAYLWERWNGDRLVAVPPPAVGEHVTIPGQLVSLF